MAEEDIYAAQDFGNEPAPDTNAAPTGEGVSGDEFRANADPFFQYERSIDNLDLAAGVPTKIATESASTKSGQGKIVGGDEDPNKGFISKMLGSVRAMFGLSDSPQDKATFAKAAIPVAGTIGMGLISGAGAGYAAEQKRKIELQRLKNDERLQASQIALNNANTRQDLSGLSFAPPSGGLINKPFTPAPFTPIYRR